MDNHSGGAVVIPFDQVQADAGHQIGSEGVTVGSLYQNLRPLGVEVPNGFIVTAEFLKQLVAGNRLADEFASKLNRLDPSNLHELFAVGGKLRASVVGADLPDSCTEAVIQAYLLLQQEYGERPDVWLRPSLCDQTDVMPKVTGSDGLFLNITGVRELIQHIKLCFATLFSDRAISFRLKHQLPPIPSAMSIVVQKMVRADRSVSGYMLTADPESGWDNTLLVDASWGLRDLIRRGTVVPDEFLMFKPKLREGRACILRRTLGTKRKKLVYRDSELTGVHIREVHVPEADQRSFCLDDARLVELGRLGLTVENLIREKRSVELPLSIEWAIDSVTQHLVVSRVESLNLEPSLPSMEVELPAKASQELAHGRGIGQGNTQGAARVLLDAEQIDDLQPGEILVTTSLEPEWRDALDKISGIMVENGSASSFGARMARAAQIPMLIAQEPIMSLIKTGDYLSLSCATDGVARAWRGPALVKAPRWRHKVQAALDTPFMLALRTPAQALWASSLPAAGVGLVRMEHILLSTVGIHPQIANAPERLPEQLRERLDQSTAGYKDLKQFVIQRIAEGAAMVAAAFYPREVIVRLSDYTSEEFTSLFGGTESEATQDHPVYESQGGASGYLSERYRASFELECAALRRVREAMGFHNLSLMTPRVRSVAEAEALQLALSTLGLARGHKDLKIYLMCDLPINALLSDQFLSYYDGMCLGLET